MEKIKQRDVVKPEKLMELRLGAINAEDECGKSHLTNKIVLSKSIKITTVFNFVECEYEDDEDIKDEGDDIPELPVLMYGIRVEGEYLDKDSLGNKERFIDDDYKENEKWKEIFPIYLIGDGCIMSGIAVYNRVNKILFVRGLAEMLKNKIEGLLNEGLRYNASQKIEMGVDLNTSMLVWYIRYKNNNDIYKRVDDEILVYHPICNEYPECLKILVKDFPDDFPKLSK